MPDPHHPRLEVTIEIPLGGFLKRGYASQVDFVSPFPCPFNYGSVHAFIGGDGDLLDAVVLGPRLRRGKRVSMEAYGAVGFTDRGIYDDKLICGPYPPSVEVRRFILRFFHFYAFCKRILNAFRGQPGPTFCNGWSDAVSAISRARRRPQANWRGPGIPF